jgi:hypothetical protein
MYYPHPLIARQMRQFPILRQPWRRYVTTYDPDAKAFEKRTEFPLTRVACTPALTQDRASFLWILSKPIPTNG